MADRRKGSYQSRCKCYGDISFGKHNVKSDKHSQRVAKVHIIIISTTTAKFRGRKRRRALEWTRHQVGAAMVWALLLDKLRLAWAVGEGIGNVAVVGASGIGRGRTAWRVGHCGCAVLGDGGDAEEKVVGSGEHDAGKERQADVKGYAQCK